MTDEIWMALAFFGGMAAAIAHFKASGWAGAAIVFGLPCALVLLFGPPDGMLHEPFPSLCAWTMLAFPGFAAGVAAVVLRIIR
jgi:hypothetical protein